MATGLNKKPELQTAVKIGDSQKAKVIKGNKAAFWAYLISENPDAVNHALKFLLKHDYLPYKPDLQKIAQAIGKLEETGNRPALRLIIDNFSFKPGRSISNELIEAINTVNI